MARHATFKVVVPPGMDGPPEIYVADVAEIHKYDDGVISFVSEDNSTIATFKDWSYAHQVDPDDL